jgi:hypothetical protein
MSILDIFRRQPVQVNVDITPLREALVALNDTLIRISPPCKYCAGRGAITTGPNMTTTSVCPRCNGTGIGRMAAE